MDDAAASEATRKLSLVELETVDEVENRSLLLKLLILLMLLLLLLTCGLGRIRRKTLTCSDDGDAVDVLLL